VKRILFVDDEPSILDGLRRMLRPMRTEWEMVFADGGEAALREMSAAAFDVIVTDMRMPQIDGAALLRSVADQYPQTARFVLSGHSEVEAVMRAVPIAHQFLTKPCDVAKLRETVTRACHLHELLADARLRTVVGDTRSLPARPEAYDAVTRALADLEVPIADVAAIVESDPALCVKVLQLVNSAFFALPRSVASIADATAMIGLTTLRDLVLCTEVFSQSPHASPRQREILADIQRRSLATANLARKLLPSRAAGSQAFLAGIAHDIGQVVLISRLADEYVTLISDVAAKQGDLVTEERARLGASHADVGAYLLGLWGLPYPILEAAAFHHDPSRLPQGELGVAGAVYVAGALVDARLGSARASDLGPLLDPAYVGALGLEAHLSEWAALADAVVGTDAAEAVA
jgi:HD-like signal output (HDOD) protein